VAKKKKRYRHDKKRAKLTKLSKVCPSCGLEKNGIEFGLQYPKNPSSQTLQSWCISCRKSKSIKNKKTEIAKQKHREYMREYMRKYRKPH
jgi:hypothetical protein